MRWHELVNALVANAGGTFAVARAMRRPTFQGTLHKIATGKVDSPSRQSAERIAAHFKIDVNALYDDRTASAEASRLGLALSAAIAPPFGVNEATRDSALPSTTLLQSPGGRNDGAHVLSGYKKTSPAGHVIQQYDTGGAMGVGLVLHDQPGLIHSWNVSDDWLRLNVRNYTSAANLCIVTGFGDSMKPDFNPGDPLLIDRGVTKVDFEGMYFFRVGEDGYIKRLQRIPGEGIRVISSNRDDGYEPWTIKPEMDFQVLGRVVKVWRGNEL